MSKLMRWSRGLAVSSAVDDDDEEVVAETFKVLVLGGSDVGKTTVVRYFTSNGVVPSTLLPTVGMDFTDIVVSVSGTRVRLRVWDTAGQERFFTFTKQFFRGTQGIMLMYDITSMASYQTLMKWLQTIHQMGMESVVTVMVGNKADLVDEREVPLQTATKLASRNGFEYLETSAMTGKNVKASFYKLAESLIFSRGIFLPGEEAQHGMQGGTAQRIENGAFRVDEKRARRGGGAGKHNNSPIKNRKLRHDSEREQVDESRSCCF